MIRRCIQLLAVLHASPVSPSHLRQPANEPKTCQTFCFWSRWFERQEVAAKPVSSRALTSVHVSAVERGWKSAVEASPWD
jgi:hypothetical protein